MIPSVLALNEMLGGAAGGWLLPLTITTVAGLLIAAVGQFLLVARVIDLSTSFVTGGLGIVPALAWVVALVWLSLGRHLLQETLGWLSLALLVSAISVAVFSGLRLHFATWTSAAVLVLVLLAWLAMLGMASWVRDHPGSLRAVRRASEGRRNSVVAATVLKMGAIQERFAIPLVDWDRRGWVS